MQEKIKRSLKEKFITASPVTIHKDITFLFSSKITGFRENGKKRKEFTPKKQKDKEN